MKVYVIAFVSNADLLFICDSFIDTVSSSGCLGVRL